MFFLQLRQLIWKNSLVRFRSKARVITEIIWPLAIFIILALVRTNGLKEIQGECNLNEKALPSAGAVRFYHSLICNSMNWCYNVPNDPNGFFDEKIEFDRARKMIQQVEDILIRGTRTVDNEALNSIFPSILPSYLSNLNATLKKSPTENQLLTSSSNLFSLLDSTTVFEPTLFWTLPENPSDKLCNSTLVDFYSMILGGLDLSEVEVEKILHLEEDIRLGEFYKDIQTMESSFLTFREISDSVIGSFAKKVSISLAETDGETGSDIIQIITALNTICGGNPLPPIPPIPSKSPLKSSKKNTFRRRMAIDQRSALNTTDSNLPEICADLFATLQNNPQTEALYEYVHPFIRGKLVYAPNTPAFSHLIGKVNETFQDIRIIQEISNTWLDLSPKVKSFLNRLENSTLDAIENFENCTALVSALENVLERIQTIETVVMDLDMLATFFSVYIECYDFDKFEGFPSEEEAVIRGLNLLDQNQLWAVIIFDNADSNNLTLENELPYHISYKIRMDKFVIDSTERIEDYVEVPLPRNDPRAGQMKYFTSGFIFLQDRIEQSIAMVQSMSEQMPGMFMQQFPGPCLVFDTFLFAIGPSFPLFMNLAFVYACAMIIKSIVHEKERRLKETMRTMGLSNGVHWTAWFIDSMSVLIFACIFLPIIIYYGNILEKSNPVVVFVFILCFSIATVCFSFLVSTLFNRANLAAASGAFIYFLSYQPCSLLDLGYGTSSYTANLLLSLFSNVAFGIGNAYLIGLEENGSGAQWDNIATSPREGDTFSLLECMLMLLLDSVIYLVITWYIETVFPGQYGIPKPWYFMFQSSYWCSSKRNKTPDQQYTFDSGRGNTELVEEESSRNLMVGVSIHNLGKTYSNGKVALRNLSIDFYENQITSFLGHNGAGKTTTISILTGLFPPSEGTATINGLDIGYQIDDIRHQLGVCPQHNVLFDQLTVEEHLRFYANLKTGGRVESWKEIDKMIEDLGLAHKRNDISQHLSGGMKRKLSIGAAFIGNSKTVILDEPTAGVDPFSRRSIWDILLKYKAGRTIILTTHFMDEADLLGDRIAIISQGQLKCCGSSLFLKQKLGSGYYLTVVRKDEGGNNGTRERTADGQVGDTPVEIGTAENETEQIASVVKRYIPNGNIVQDVGSDLVFCLPEFDEGGQRQRDKFPSLFDELDSNMDRLGLDSYGVSDTTLEEIFLKVANDPLDDSTPIHVEPEQALSGELPVLTTLRKSATRECVYEVLPQREENATSDTLSMLPSQKLTGATLVCQQFIALYIKRFCNSKRNLKGFFCEIVLPALFIVINQLTTMALNPTAPEPPIILSPWLYGQSNIAFYANQNPNGIWPNIYVENMLNETGLGARCVGDKMKGLPCFTNNTGLLNPFVNPDDYQDFRCPCSDGIAYCPANLTTAELPRYKSVSTDDFYDVTNKDISLWIIRTSKALKKSRIGGFEFGVRNLLQNFNFTLFSQDANDLAKALRFLEPFQVNISSQIMNFENITRFNGTFDNVKVWFDNKAWASSVSYLNAINNVILRSSLPATKNATSYSINSINHPMNYSSRELQDRLMRQVGISVLHAISVIFSMSFVPASFVIFLVEERVSKAKHLQFVSGVKPITFWVASYTWDLVNYLIPCVLVIIIFLGFDQQAYIGPENIGGMILLLVLYGLSAIPLMYPASLIFSVSSSAFVGLACGNLFIGVVTTISSFVLQLFDDEQLKLIGSILNEVYLIFPHYCLGRGMIDMAQVYFTTQRLKLLGIDYERSVFEWNYLGRYFLSMIIQAIVFFSVTVMLHYQVCPERIVRYFQKTTLPPLPLEDEDVARERERVEQEQESSDELRLLRLTKVYGRGKGPATDRLSFGLKKGECFGLLGVNGAGKSTTFKMLTGDETVTCGNAFVGGFSILSNLTEAQQSLGYCPQEDALLSLLTGTEHLKLFARLRGVPLRHIDKVVSDSLKKLDLLPYKNRCAGTYSGGNKRKLSTAIAFIGNPAVVFLDEPSSGMDPKARRSLWEAIIDAVKDSRSILLTSHSMEECQVLCTRLAVMVNGTLRCLGSAQHLKNRFGDGYMINVRCEMESVSDVLQYIQAAIPEARLRERRSRQLIWQIQLNVLPISTLFNRMETARAATNMVDYSITQTTLDDVFVRFARLQRETIEENSDQGLDVDDPPTISPLDSADLSNQEHHSVSINPVI